MEASDNKTKELKARGERSRALSEILLIDENIYWKKKPNEIIRKKLLALKVFFCQKNVSRNEEKYLNKKAWRYKI